MTKLYLPNDYQIEFTCPRCGSHTLWEGARDVGVDWPASYLEVKSIDFNEHDFHVAYMESDACQSFSPDQTNPICTEIWYECECQTTWEAIGPDDPSSVYWDTIAFQLGARASNNQ